MKPGMMLVTAILVAIALVVAALWGWQMAPDLALDWGAARPELGAWAVRSAAVAAFAGGQVVLLIFVAGKIYRRGAFDAVIGLTAAVVFALAAVSAVACGLAGG